MTNKKHTVYLIVGASGSGKTTLADYLEKRYGMKVLRSYTTRPKRHENDTDHEYITNNEYYLLNNKVATTYINGYYYCATAEQVSNSDLYVIDWRGVDKLYEAKRTTNLLDNVTFKIVYLDTSKFVCAYRMFKRGDSFKNIIKRLKIDKKSRLSDINFANAYGTTIIHDREDKTVTDKAVRFVYEAWLNDTTRKE